ncbi:hypothetical protein BUALT_Bualt10G0117200 [Buddleja alternifolia]|uniref:Root cap n=1 Tax=Buddleja alternifolia TaxID=168488 RepID=A0AAV6WY17_9LAMI|nr:hypothetical protein BUALT_Bualt10G0117200 [Buddleja alternifolia]
MARLFLPVIVLLMVALSEGVPHKPKKIKCKDKNFPLCYKKDLYCPDACLRDCEVDCATCQPICVPPLAPVKVKCQDRKYRRTCDKEMYCPASCPKTCVADCFTCQPVCPPTGYTPPPVSPRRPPPPVVTPTPPTPPTITPSPSPPVVTPSPPTPPAVTPSPPPVVTPSPPTGTPSPPPDSSEAAGGRRVRCRNRLYMSCYYVEHRCPAACPDSCEVDCVTCSPVCNCNRPGAVCQDPRFIGADGITFYFHGKKNKDFCIVSDTNLHINAHFIGRRNENMGRDFTWVQSLGILFDNHQIFIGAQKTATWDNAIDRLELSYDGLPVYLAEGEGAKWQPTTAPGVTITRSRDTNAVVIEVEGNFQIKATVVPITEKDSKIHKYGITDEDCFAHLDLGFKFYSMSGEVNGVLGQTYASSYVSRVKMGEDMPVLGGRKEFASSDLFSTDCAVARFNGTQLSSSNDFQYANLKCASGLDGRGVVCKR